MFVLRPGPFTYLHRIVLVASVVVLVVFLHRNMPSAMRRLERNSSSIITPLFSQFKKTRWRRQRNGLPQGIVLAPMLCNMYTNVQLVHADTRSFIYADDLCITSQGNDFNDIEASLTSALSTMTTYYDKNQLRANPSKAQVCAFHLRNREAKRELNVVWNGARLSNTTTPMYLGVHLD